MVKAYSHSLGLMRERKKTSGRSSGIQALNTVHRERWWRIKPAIRRIGSSPRKMAAVLWGGADLGC